MTTHPHTTQTGADTMTETITTTDLPVESPRREVLDVSITERFHGYQAINIEEIAGATLCKYADPIEGSRDGLDVESAREIATEDPGLIYLDVTTTSP